jgi:hypothetical protein
MKKEQIVARLHDSMVERATKKIEAGKEDFPAYPWLLGRLAVSLLVGVGEKSDPFYNQVNQAIVEAAPSRVYAIQSDTGSGGTDGRNRVRANLAPIDVRLGEKVQTRAISPRTQTR